MPQLSVSWQPGNQDKGRGNISIPAMPAERHNHPKRHETLERHETHELDEALEPLGLQHGQHS